MFKIRVLFNRVEQRDFPSFLFSYSVQRIIALSIHLVNFLENLFNLNGVIGLQSVCLSTFLLVKPARCHWIKLAEHGAFPGKIITRVILIGARWLFKSMYVISVEARIHFGLRI